MKCIDIAIEIYSELGSPTDISETLISLYLRENIGTLNNLISACYSINPDTSEISPEPGENEKSILKELYYLYYYDKKTRDTLALATTDSILEVTEGGATVRLLNKNEMAKNFISLKKDQQIKLNNLVSLYKSNGAGPTQVVSCE